MVVGGGCSFGAFGRAGGFLGIRAGGRGEGAENE